MKAYAAVYSFQDARGEAIPAPDQTVCIIGVDGVTWMDPTRMQAMIDACGTTPAEVAQKTVLRAMRAAYLMDLMPKAPREFVEKAATEAFEELNGPNMSCLTVARTYVTGEG